ncbi:MAG: BatA domain-containing protein [Ignavibacteriae bacterium]|nr:BatA domain-containing protein [Ignavibacteriota bacterium]
MTFLNPLVLFGTLAAAIPVILHLLNLRKLRTIEFSTLRFLKELQQTKIRKLKIRQLLLLIIRTLLVLLLVLAFARPAFRGTLLGTIGGNAHSSVVFIVDDSFSMSASDERGELLKQSKENILKLIDLLTEGDEVFLLKLSDLPDATISPATHDFRSLRKIVSDISISSVTRPLNDAIRLSSKLLSESKNANKEVYVISDMQQTLFTEMLAPQNQPSQSLFDVNVKFFLINLGTSASANVAIDSVEVKTTLVEKDKPVNVFTSIRNFSGNVQQNYVVSVFLEGVRVAQNSVRLDPWSSATLDFSLTPKKSGFVKGYVELETDAVEQDNRRYFTIHVPEKISVAVVSNSQNESRFPMLALRSGDNQEGHALFDIKQTTAKDFQFLDINKFDVLVVSFPDGLTLSSVGKIKNFVSGGGGLVLYPSSNYQQDEISRALLTSLSIPQVERVVGSEQSTSSLSFKEIDYDHPLFATVFEKNQTTSAQNKLNVESPSILKTLARTVGKEAHMIISLSDGSAFFSEHNLGSGKILFYSAAPTLSWSDFPVKGIFVPLMYRSVVYTSSRGKTQYSFTTGDEPVVNLQNVPLALMSGTFKLNSPDGMEELVSQSSENTKQSGTQRQGSGLSIGLKKLTQSGFYQLNNQNELLTIIAVNTNKNESDGRKIESDALAKFWKQFGIESAAITTLDKPEDVQITVTQSRFGVELWKHCLALALMLALLEMFIARDSRKETQQMFAAAQQG